MWTRMVDGLRRLMYKMGFIQGINSITEKRDVMVTDDHYQLVEKWAAWYSGYYKPFHDAVDHTIEGQKPRRKMTLNMPKIASAEMASLVFNENCDISVTQGENEEQPLGEFIENVLKDNRFIKRFQRYLEYMFASGGMIAKVFVKNNKIRVAYVDANAFYPISSENDVVKEGVFANVSKRGDKKYTLLEWHTWQGDQYVIENELYETSINNNDLGVRRALATIYPDLDERVTIDGLERPLFVMFKPNTANNFDMTSPLGISIFANALDTLELIDTAFDSYKREFQFGQKTILVPAAAVKSVVDPQSGQQKRYFDATNPVYQAMGFGGQDSDKIYDLSVELRVDEHIDALNSLLNILSMQIGFSAGTFAFDGSEGLKTATEVVSENSQTFRTKNSHETFVEESLVELVHMIVDVAKLYNLYSSDTEEYDVAINFDDSIAEDRDSNADYYTKLVNGGLYPKVRGMMKIHKVTEDEAKQMLEEIKKEQEMNAPSDEELFGADR